ncbi:MAG: DUF3105 domain-containing protein [Candidatus Eisenbacteria bacterium]
MRVLGVVAAMVMATLAATGCTKQPADSRSGSVKPGNTPSEEIGSTDTQSGQTQSTDIPGVQVYTNLGHAHTTAPVHYEQVPPVGGDHNPALLNCGIYDEPVPAENAVHSLEHGAVWITYQPALPQPEIGRLRELVRGHDHLILSPYPDLSAPVIASGWGVQIKLERVDDPRLPRFISKYEGGPQAREPGAPCTGGIGTPIEH